MPGAIGGANTTEYGDISPRVGMAAAAKMLEHARPILVLSKLGQTRPMPKNKGQTLKFRRPVPFAAATTPLTEGVAPSAQKMVYADVTATLQQFGAWTELTDVIADTHEDPVLQDVTMLIGEQAAETVETLIYGNIIGGTSFLRAGASGATVANRNQINEPLHLKHQRSATRTLKAQRGKKITKILGPSVNISTQAIEASYVAVAHTDVESSIRDLAGFVPVAKYGNRQPICAEEIGSVEDVRYILSPLFVPWADAGALKGGGSITAISTTGTNADVYPILYMAQESFGLVPLKGKEAVKPMVLNPNVPRGGDPLGQAGSVAWKTWHESLILNEAWIVRVEVAVEE